MGCSASRSRPHSFITKTSDDQFLSNPSPSYSSSPFPRALSLQTTLVHHPPLRKGDTHHLVCLTSSTYGSLLLLDPKNPTFTAVDDPFPSPSADPEVINAWELMDGLDDDAAADAVAFYLPAESPKKPSSFQYLGGDLSPRKLLGAFGSVTSMVECATSPPLSKPLWKHLSEEALLAKMDPNVAASYMRALCSRHLSYNQPKTPNRTALPPPDSPRKLESPFSLPGTADRVVLYFTSLRGIRKTYEDCCSVQMILRGYRVHVDERDISMDSEFKKELQNVFGGKAMTLPRVFIRGNHIGGADEIKQLNEAGELAKLLEGFPARDPGFVCERCGDARFMPCPNCNGSRKIFEEEGQLRRCPDCNENGLIRCPDCSS